MRLFRTPMGCRAARLVMDHEGFPSGYASLQLARSALHCIMGATRLRALYGGSTMATRARPNHRPSWSNTPRASPPAMRRNWSWVRRPGSWSAPGVACLQVGRRKPPSLMATVKPPNLSAHLRPTPTSRSPGAGWPASWAWPSKACLPVWNGLQWPFFEDAPPPHGCANGVRHLHDESKPASSRTSCVWHPSCLPVFLAQHLLMITSHA